jgi:DNA-binding YbaB/EbfC family protein
MMNQAQMMKQMQQMQAKMAKIQDELAEETVEATAGGNAVKVVISGQQKIRSVEIDPSVVDPEDVEMLQDLMVAAFNEALAKSQELAASRMAALTGGLKIPGLS